MAALALSLAVGACTLVTDLDGLASSGAVDGGDDGASPDTSTDGATRDASDAAVGDGPPSVLPCTRGATRTPVAVSLYPASVSATSGCGLERMLVLDGVFGGLDRAPGSNDTNLDGQPITSCALLDFGIEYAIARVGVTLRGAASACNLSGCSPGPEGGCDTGHFTQIFTSVDGVAFKHASSSTFTRAAEVEDVAVTAATLRYVLACRGSSGTARDDLEIDGVVATCR